MVEELRTTLVSFFLGGGFVLLIVKFFIERWLKNLTEEKDAVKKKRVEKFKAEYEYRHAIGRLIYHIHRGIYELEQEQGKRYWDGPFDQAFQQFEEAEKNVKDLEVEELAEANMRQ